MNEPNYIIGNSKNINKIFKQKKLGKPQLIISSPPYFNILNYENNKDQIGFGQSYFEYLSDVSHVFQDCYKLSENNATFWLIIDTLKKDGEIKTLPFDINNRLQKRFKKTWKLKEIIIWDKEKNLPWNGKGNFKNQFEYILFFTKNDKFKFHIDRVREINDLKKWWKTYPERYNPDGKAPSNVWNYITPIRGWGDSKQNHLCPFPFSLVEKIISIASDKGDLVLDPFAGSGSVLCISCMMERNSVGIDVNKEYKTLFKEEVLLGAKVYWDKREKELKKNKNAIEEFKLTNEKLRKLKVTSIKDNIRWRVRNHLFSSPGEGWSGISVDILLDYAVSHRKKAMSTQPRAKTAYVNRERVTNKVALLQLNLTEAERNYIQNTASNVFYFRNGINISEEKHLDYEFRVYFIVGLSSATYMDFIEKEWRRKYGLPKLCSYSSGR